MPIYNDNIKNYFRPFAATQGLQKKRPLSKESIEEPNVKRLPLNNPWQKSTFEYEEAIGLSVKRALPNLTNENGSSFGISDQIPSTPSLIETEGQNAPQLEHSTSLREGSTMCTPAFSGSQTALASSQRIIRNGETVIRNSDDDSESSLEDLDNLIGRKPSGAPPSPPAYDLAEAPLQALVRENPRIVTKGRKRKPGWVEKPAPPHRLTLPVLPKNHQFSLESLAKQRKQHEATKGGIAQALSLIESYDQRKASSSESSILVDQAGSLDKDLLASLIKEPEDDDNAGRLKTAIQRTEALQYSKSWSFFGDPSDTPRCQRADLPVVEDERLKLVLDEPICRQQAFLSGYVTEYALKATLPEELLVWMMDEICLEARDDIRFAYTDTLKRAVAQVSSLLTVECIDKLFRRLGATAVAIDIQRPVVPRAVFSHSVGPVGQPCLLSILNLLRHISGALAGNCRTHLFGITCRLAMDQTIVENFHAIDAIGKLFSKLIDSYDPGDNDHELQTVLTATYHSTNDTNLRLQLLQIITPSRQSNLFRQRLALSFFFSDPHYLRAAPNDLMNLKHIADHLQGPQYAINSASDYAELAASIDILSIAIGCGNPPSSDCPKEDEIAFNSDVDTLAAKIRSMFTQIVDTSASHMKKTEAKEILEGFHSRLVFAVRTRPPPKKSTFGSSVTREVGDMDAFVVRRKEDG